MSYLCTFYVFIHLFIITPIFGSLTSVTALFDRRGWLWWPLSRLWGWTLTSVLTQGVKVRGYEHVSVDRGAILMANHTSHIDPPLLICISSIPLRFLTKKVLFYFPFFGWAMWMMGHIPVDRRNRDQAFASLRKASKVIAAGRVVAIFPEGTRIKRGQEELSRFKKGGFVIAVQGGIPIVPVGIAGTRESMQTGWTWVTPKPVKVVFGPPIDTSTYTLETKDALMELVRERMVAVRQEAEDWQNEG